MTRKRQQVWYSHIQYCPDPAVRDGCVDLGIAFEFKTKQFWAIAVAVRADLDKAQLEHLDDLTRAILDRRVEILGRELEQVLPTTSNFGDAVKQLAAANPWSLSVSPPKKAMLSLIASEKLPPSELAEKLTVRIFMRELEEQRRAEPAGSRRAAMRRHQSDITPPWMYPPKTVVRQLEAA